MRLSLVPIQSQKVSDRDNCKYRQYIRTCIWASRLLLPCDALLKHERFSLSPSNKLSMPTPSGNAWCFPSPLGQRLRPHQAELCRHCCLLRANIRHLRTGYICSAKAGGRRPRPAAGGSKSPARESLPLKKSILLIKSASAHI